MIEMLLLAIGLAMDALAVAIGLGAAQAGRVDYPNGDAANPNQPQSIIHLALLAALYFGLAQGVMPLLGYLLGSVMLGWLATAAAWVGCIILVGLGIKMIYDPIFAKDDHQISQAAASNVDHTLLLTLAIATSIDAMAAGFTLNLFPFNAGLGCLLIAAVTAALSFVGVYVGNRSGTWLEDKAALFGGMVLIGIGIHRVL